MDAAMAAGSGDSEMESDGDDESGLESADEDEDDYDDAELDDEDMEDGESFHTASEDEEEEDEDEEDDGAESDESETLRDGPLTPKEIQMRAQMDAIFAAMNKAEGIVPPKPAKADKKGMGTSQDVPEPQVKKAKKKTGPMTEEDENALYDLSAGVPLSAAALEEAEAELQSKKKKAAGKQEQEKRNAAAAKKRGNKRKRRKTETVEKDLGGSTLHLLQPVLSAGDGLPPVIDAGSQQKRASAKSRFMKNAMKESGRIPGKAILDGRRRR